MSILAVQPGAYYHIESIEGPRYAGLFDAAVRPDDLADVDLGRYDALLVPCRTPSHQMVPHTAQLRAYLDSGGTIVATGESHSEEWLPGISFTPVPTNWWWWLDPAGDLGVRVAKPEHPLFRRLSQADVTWHLHGWFVVPDGAEVLAVDGDRRPILYIDEVTTAGRMILTTLDPFFHHGSHFMPATTRFLDGFLPWLVEDLAERKASR